MRARPQLTTLAVLAIVATAACVRRDRRTPDDTVVYLIDSNLVELDTRWATSSQEIKVSRLIEPALVSVDQQSMEPRFELAEAVVNVDPRTWDVTVRAGVRFPDGSPLTARDVAYTFNSTIDPKVRSAYFRHFSERLEGVEVLDERRARFHLKEPLATFVTDLDYGIVSERLALAQDHRWSNGFTVGAGAFQLKHLEPGLAVVERNPSYFGPPPPMRRVEFRTMIDINARLLVLVGGSADLMLNAVRLDLLPRLEEKPRLQITTAPGSLLTYLMMKNDDPILSDPRVRQAIAYAIDREKIVRGKLGGHAVLATGLIPPSHWAYSGDVLRYGHDPDKARALLDAAGYRDPDGPGPLPRMTLTYKTSSDGFRIAIARLIPADLAEIGIAVDVRPFEFATFFADIKRGNYQLASMQTSEIAEPDMYFPYFHSSRIPSPQQPDLGNRWRYHSARADELIERGRHTLDRAARKTIYAELQRLMSEDVPIVPLWHEHNVAIANRDLRDFELLPNARIPSLARVAKAQ